MTTASMHGRALSVLLVSACAFTVCFMVWMMFGVIGIPIMQSLGLSATEFGFLTATPVLTGALIRVPLGIWTDKYGGRIVMALLMAVTVPAIWLTSYATAYWHFLVVGLFVGLAGGAFTDGTPYVARWFRADRQRFAMGVYGAGNSGAAVSWLSDKYGAHRVTWWVLWVSSVCLFLLSYPQTDFTVATANGARTYHIGLNVYAFTGLMLLPGIAFPFGKASVFKYISDDYPNNLGTVSGIVGLAGGLGGFVVPILFGVLMDFTGIRSSAFMLMYGVVWVALIWMYLTEVRRTEVMGKHAHHAASTDELPATARSLP